jgi:hypothetical protein
MKLFLAHNPDELKTAVDLIVWGRGAELSGAVNMLFQVSL